MHNIYFMAGFWANIKNDLGVAVDGMLRGIFYSICSTIYKMIYYFYNVFSVLCSGELLDPSTLNKLFGRISVLLGLIMLLRVAISFIQALIDPDTGLGDKEKGIPNVIKKVVIVIIMFGISGYVFDLSKDIQALIIKENVITKFLFPQEEVDNEKFGGALAADLFTTFYNINPNVDKSTFGTSNEVLPDFSMGKIGTQSANEYNNSSNEAACVSEDYINTLRKEIKENNDFSYMKNKCIAVTGVYKDDPNEDVYVIEFNYIFCFLVGIAVLWFLINYCLSVGIRVIQLTVLQLISPIAFIGYLEPKSDNMFSKWLKVYISTYIDVFIRMGIISFVCYICALIMEGWNDGSGVFWESVGNPTGFVAKVIGIFMILALFQFAKKAPDLLKSIFPTGSSGLSFGTNKDAFKPLGYAKTAAAATAGGIVGGLSSGVSRAITNKNQGRSKLLGFGSGLITGTGRGLMTGRNKGFMAAMEANRTADNKYDELVAGGGSNIGRIGARIADQFGLARGDENRRQIERYQRVIDTNKKLQDIAEGFTDVKTAKGAWEAARLRGASDSELAGLWKTYKKKRRDAINQSIENPNSFEDSEQRALAAQISMENENLQSYYTANNITLSYETKDNNGNPIKVEIKPENVKDVLKTAEIYEEASFAASSAQTKIMSDDKYSAAAANAEAAGAVGKRSGGNN